VPRAQAPAGKEPSRATAQCCKKACTGQRALRQAADAATQVAATLTEAGPNHWQRQRTRGAGLPSRTAGCSQASHTVSRAGRRPVIPRRGLVAVCCGRGRGPDRAPERHPKADTHTNGWAAASGAPPVVAWFTWQLVRGAGAIGRKTECATTPLEDAASARAPPQYNGSGRETPVGARARAAPASWHRPGTS